MFTYSLIPKVGLKSDLLVLFVPEKALKNSFEYLESILPDYTIPIKRVLDHKDFKGELKENLLLYPAKDNIVRRILLIGYGKLEKIESEKLREIGFLIGKKQSAIKAKNIHIILDNELSNLNNAVKSVAEGILYSGYSFNEFKSEKKDKNIQATYCFLSIKEEIKNNLKSEFRKLLAINEGIIITRNLANIPSNHLTPRILQKNVKNLFRDVKSVKIEVLNKTQLAEKKFRLLLSVAQGSKQDPSLIILRYQPEKSNTKKIVIVGKGVTFDSGGISIKPSANMDEMKFDMAGAAATVGIIKTASILKPKTELIGIIPAVENMPGGNAVKPGDIIKAYNGKTVEILNTDAEGRLILADALAYAVKRFKPKLIIDFATLTGSIVAALGDKMAGMFTNSDEISDIFKRAGNLSGDQVWAMPLLDSYSKLLESKYADIANIGGKWGGAITAAKFLENFISTNKWVHFDIAGTANDVKNVDYLPSGATGYGPRLFFTALEEIEQIL